MTDQLNTKTVWLRVKKDGKSEVLEARCYAKEEFFTNYRRWANERGITVEEITQAQYKSEKSDAMVGVVTGSYPRLLYR